jgi:3-phosphoshikimate 1-carboxyvinyltransferase
MHSTTVSPMTAAHGNPLRGRVRVPGDKSISHRALILGALAVGPTRISQLLEGEDVINTGKVMQALGARIERQGVGEWRVDGVGVGGFAQPRDPLDFGNSATGCRLVMGATASCPISVTFDGDASLRKRPMQRVIDPLTRMGAQALASAPGGRLPVTLRGARDPIPIVYEPPAASAQLKSAVLLAGLGAPGATTVFEKEATRDHTERMLSHFGAEVVVEIVGGGRRITVTGQPELNAAEVVVPADPSSAAFPLVAALITRGSDLVIEGVMTNPLRTGLSRTLLEMGASIETVAARSDGGEEVADLRVRSSGLKGVEVPAACAQGATIMRGLKELRVKESDRLAATAAMLRVNGVEVEIDGDDLIVHGRGRAPGGGVVETHMDHRIAMSTLVMGLATEKPVRADDVSFVATSFPGFADMMRSLGANLT